MRVLALLLVLASCGDGSFDGDARDFRPQASDDVDRLILGTLLEFDVASKTGAATLDVETSFTRALTLEVGDLVVNSVSDEFGALDYFVSDSLLRIGLPFTGDPNVVRIDYSYSAHNEFDGAMDRGMTLTWPYYCGNLFPCRSNPSQGSEFEMVITGAAGETIYPEFISAKAPSYMPAWAIGNYTYEDLGTTGAGTRVGVYTLPGGTEDAEAGTANLVEVFQWFESNLGPYLYGPEVASVSVDWGPGAFGGMEHHPYWHVANSAMSDESTHAHEAAHGWFGNGVRIACWEDFVLSEGTVSYLAARSLEAVAGFEMGQTIWASYEQSLNSLQLSTRNKIAWPQGCNEIDIIEDGLFGTAPYMKGAFFYKALANRVGVTELDAALGSFYLRHAESAATMQDMLDHILETTGYDPAQCAQDWLRSVAVPESDTCP